MSLTLLCFRPGMTSPMKLEGKRGEHSKLLALKETTICFTVQVKLYLIDTDPLDNLMRRWSIQTSPPLHSLAIHCYHRSRQSPPRKGGLGRPQLDRPILHHLIGRRRKRRRMWIIEKGKGVKGCRGSTEKRQPWP